MVRYAVQKPAVTLGSLAAACLLLGCSGQFTPAGGSQQRSRATSPQSSDPRYRSQPTAVAGCGNPTVSISVAPTAPAPVQQALSILCQYSPRELEPDEMTPLGFTAAERLAPVLGQQVLPVEWSTAAPASTQLVFEAQLNGRPRLLTSAMAGCRPKFEVDLDIRLTTADGALAEAYTATASTYNRDFLTLDHELDAAAVARVRSVQPGIPAAQMSVPLLFSAYGLAGGVLIKDEPLDDGLYGARWPHACDPRPFPTLLGKLPTFPIQNPTTRPGVDDLVARFRRAGNMVRVDGSPVGATYQPQGAPRRACFAIRDGAYVDGVQVEVDLEVRPAMGPPLTIPVRLSQELGHAPWPPTTQMQAAGPCTRSYQVPAREFAARCGDWGIDLSGYQTGDLSFSSHLDRACAPVMVSLYGSNCASSTFDTRFDGQRICRGTSSSTRKGEAILFLDPP
jgi:hypothetical protein